MCLLIIDAIIVESKPPDNNEAIFTSEINLYFTEDFTKSYNLSL